ncbi:hypothetical protein [Vibrio vulnificus]|uniref:hypothetical protein n=1 Tax=Vibrio vulnificus TaxID=672 RepID=UPI000A39A779|nr:hypothetical protein [Vibrio vulnificus]EIU7611141.1 hypothetical protein [Vibrio vulnificus]EIU7861037.1 hypothetical protein [Vibrio vulnificus]EJE8577311.1 hypothetical protein [Vibrio vulnificus]EKA7348914.1 hypothetical protein [Vibrio vulnificus]ELQ2335114.1 hypothetical protein [Vibrio vulnificus]
MRAGTNSDDIRGSSGSGVNRSSAKKKRQGTSVSLPISMLTDLELIGESLLFEEHIKSTSASKIVELALLELFQGEAPPEIAKRIASSIRKLSR